ncbi:hypothetical protein [Sphingomonas oryzagri]
MDTQQDQKLKTALDGISVAPPEPVEGEHPTPEVREAQDAGDHDALSKNPSHEDGKLDVGLDESFPTSDPASATQPGHADPAPSSGYDEEAEKALEREKAERR